MCAVPDGAQWTRVEEIVQLIPTMKSIGADKQENKASKSNEAEKCDQIATKEEKIDFSKFERFSRQYHVDCRENLYVIS